MLLKKDGVFAVIARSQIRVVRNIDNRIWHNTLNGDGLSVVLYNNLMNTRALIGQSAMVYCASKLMEILRVFRIIILKQ